jgi:flagellar hook-length control protein FliK
MHLQWRDGVGEAKMTLTPESLGEVTIAMKVEKGVVTATIKAENPVTMEWIRSHQHELRDALAAQGLKLDTLDVSVDPEGRRRQEESAQQQQAPRRPRGGTLTETPRFELVV